MKIIAKGFVIHRFWGEYSASIVLCFDTVQEKEIALDLLNQRKDFGDYHNACGGRTKSEGWRQIEHGQGDAAKALFCDVADPVLAEIVEEFVIYGANRKKILSMARSINYGEEFEIEIEVEDKSVEK